MSFAHYNSLSNFCYLRDRPILKPTFCYVYLSHSPYLECFFYRSQQNSSLWEKSYIHCKEFQSKHVLACCTLKDALDNCIRKFFSIIMLHSNMSKINDLVSDSRSLNHHWLTKAILTHFTPDHDTCRDFQR